MSEESVLEFPCDFPIKLMGRDTPEFRRLARVLVEKHTGKLTDDVVQTSQSRNGQFVSVTITVRATNQRMLDDIYRDASAHVDVLMAL